MPASVETLCVAPDRVPAMWPHVARWLTTAAEKCGDWTPMALRDVLVKGDALLWVRWDGEQLKAACVTELVIVPRGKILRVLACGGGKAGDWPAAFAPIERYAREQGCNAIRIEGRRGWQRVFADYRQAWVCIEKGL